MINNNVENIKWFLKHILKYVKNIIRISNIFLFYKTLKNIFKKQLQKIRLDKLVISFVYAIKYVVWMVQHLKQFVNQIEFVIWSIDYPTSQWDLVLKSMYHGTNYVPQITLLKDKFKTFD